MSDEENKKGFAWIDPKKSKTDWIEVEPNDVPATAVLAHVISVLRHMGISASSVAAILDRLDQIAFKQALDEFEANLVEEVILTLPISRYFEPDDEGDLATVHTSIVSAHETLDEIDALYIRLTDISRGIKEGHI